MNLTGQFVEGDARRLQAEMLVIAQELTELEARVRRLHGGLAVDGDVEAMVEGLAPRSLELELDGALETAVEEIAAASAALRSGGLKTAAELRRQFACSRRVDGSRRRSGGLRQEREADPNAGVAPAGWGGVGSVC